MGQAPFAVAPTPALQVLAHGGARGVGLPVVDRLEDAAVLDLDSEFRLIMRHMMPSLYSHIIAAITLAIPNMILAESSLSFLGLGLQPPIVGWGVLLQDTQNLRAITQAPWLFVPGICIVIAVLTLNFLGDGVRDAADPYAK